MKDSQDERKVNRKALAKDYRKEKKSNERPAPGMRFQASFTG